MLDVNFIPSTLYTVWCNERWATSISPPQYKPAIPPTVGTTDNRAPWRPVRAAQDAGNKKLHHPPAIRASFSLEIEHPPYTHDCGLGPLINGQTEGFKDSIMAKHRKDRDSWGECTYNLIFHAFPLDAHTFFFLLLLLMPAEARV